jgi:hypothetical protein
MLWLHNRFMCHLKRNNNSSIISNHQLTSTRMLTITRITRSSSSSKIISSNNPMIKSRTTTATPTTITDMISNISSQLLLQDKMITKTHGTRTDNHHTTNSSRNSSSINKTTAINSNSSTTSNSSYPLINNINSSLNSGQLLTSLNITIHSIYWQLLPLSINNHLPNNNRTATYHLSKCCSKQSGSRSLSR